MAAGTTVGGDPMSAIISCPGRTPCDRKPGGTRVRVIYLRRPAASRRAYGDPPPGYTRAIRERA